MPIFLVFLLLFVGSNALAKPQYNVTIQNRHPQSNLINIGLPTIKLPNLIPTALPIIKLPTLKPPNILPTPTSIKASPTTKIPDITSKPLPTLGPIKLTTMKLTTLPRILSTKSPKPTKPPKTTKSTKPTPSREGNVVCEICEKVIGVLTTRLLEIIEKFKVNADKFLTNVCTSLTSNPATFTFGTVCVMLKGNIIDGVFNGFDKFKKNLEPVSFCKHVPFCK